MQLNSLPTTLLLSIASTTLGCLLFASFLFFTLPIKQSASAAVVAPFPPPLALAQDAVAAKAAIVYDPTDGRILFAKYADESLPLASLTKLMTAQVVLQSEPTSTLVTILPQDLATEGDAGDWGFRAGQVVSINDLIKIGLVASSNDAMAAAAASLGANYMNEINKTAGSLGLTHTYFLNPTGLDLNNETSGAYGSAGDVALLAAAFLREYPQYFELTAQPDISIDASGKKVVANATAVPLQNIPGFIGAKTGYTDLAGGNLVVAFDIDIGHPLIAVVLGSSEKGRFADMRALINAARLSAHAAAATTSSS